jgi:hypothetical protein
MSKNAFTEWFEAQFGPFPTCRTWKELEMTIKRGEVARATLENLQRYKEARDAALKAWFARETEP